MRYKKISYKIVKIAHLIAVLFLMMVFVNSQPEDGTQTEEQEQLDANFYRNNPEQFRDDFYLFFNDYSPAERRQVLGDPVLMGSLYADPASWQVVVDFYNNNPQNLIEYPEGAENMLQIEATQNSDYVSPPNFFVDTRDRTAIMNYNPETRELSNGQTSITVDEYTADDEIEVLPGGGFLINGALIKGGKLSKDKQRTHRFILTASNGDTFEFMNPNPQIVSGEQPDAVIWTPEGFRTEGPARGVATVNGERVEFDSREGRFAILNDGTIAADNAQAYRNNRLYDGRFVTKGDETTLIPLPNGKQSEFYDFSSESEIAVKTNGGEVDIHSDQLPSDTIAKGNQAPPASREEAQERAKNTQAVAPPPSNENKQILGEVWYKGDTVIAKGFVDVRGSNGVEAFHFFGNGHESDFYRHLDRETGNIVTSAKGRAILELGQQDPFTPYNRENKDEELDVRFTSDSTIYPDEGEKPEEIILLVTTTEDGEAFAVDAPNDGLDAIKLKRKTNAYESYGQVGIRAVSVDRGSQDFEITVSKTDGELDFKLSKETLSFLGEARENPNIFITLHQEKDFLVNGIGSDVYFGLSKEMGLMQQDEQWVGVLGPEGVRSAIGELIEISDAEAEAIQPFIEQLSTTDAEALDELDLSGVSRETIDKIASGDPVIKKLMSCVNDEKSCNDKDAFFKAYTNFNKHREDEGTIEYAQSYFDLMVASDTKPDPRVSATLVLSYLEKGDLAKAEEIKDKSQDKNVQRYVNAIMHLEDMKRTSEAAERELHTKYSDKFAYVNGEIEFFESATKEDKEEILKLHERMRFKGDPEQLAVTIFILGKVEEDSPMAPAAKDMMRAYESKLLASWEASARGQAAQTSEKLQGRTCGDENWCPFTGVGNAIAYKYMSQEQREASEYINAQAMGISILRKANANGHTVRDIGRMDANQKRELINELFPNADDDDTEALLGWLYDGLNNPSVQALRKIENGASIEDVKTTLPPTFTDKYILDKTTPDKVLFPDSYVETPLLDGYTNVEYSFGALNVVSSMIAAGGYGGPALVKAGKYIGPALAAHTPTFYAIGASVAGSAPTLAPLAAETALGYGFEKGITAFGVSDSFAMVASGFIAINPAAKAGAYIDDVIKKAGKVYLKDASGEFVEYGIRKADDGAGYILTHEGEEIATNLKGLIDGVGTGEMRFGDDAATILARDAFEKNQKALDDYLKRQDDVMADQLDVYKVSKEQVERINKEHGTNFILDENGNVVGAKTDFDKAGLPVSCS